MLLRSNLESFRNLTVTLAICALLAASILGSVFAAPKPHISGISPSNVTAGGPGFTLVVSGRDFTSNCVVRIAGNNRTTTFVSPTELTAEITAADIQAGDTFQTTVIDLTDGGTSNPKNLSVNNPVPTTSSISPTRANVGGAAFTLTVNGSNFVGNSVVQFNGANRSTTFVNSTQLTAQITSADLQFAGSFPVRVVNPPPDGGTSSAVTFTVSNLVNPAPTLSNLSPESATAGGTPFTLTANGNNFVNGSVVRFNGSDRITSFVSSTQVTAQITAADIATAGTFPVTAFNPAPGGGTSSAVNFTVTDPVNPAPTLSNLSPASATAGGTPFTLTANGTDFVNGSVVRFNGSDRITNFLSSTQLTAQITAADIGAVETFPVTVFNPAPGGGTSNAVNFSVNNPVPAVTTLSPATKFAGDAAFTLTVNGTNFNSSSMVQFNGNARATTFVSNTQLTAQILAADIAAVGTLPITVFNSAPGGGTSNVVNFTVASVPLPVIIAPLTPASMTAGGMDFPLTVNGTDFVVGSVVRFNGIARATTFVSATQLTTMILAADIAIAGAYPITVFNPAPGGGISNAINLPVNPSITTISPASVRAGDLGFTLTVVGGGFAVGDLVRFNGSNRSTTFLSSTQLTASILASDIAVVGTYQITVLTPTSLTSNALNITAVPSITNLTPLTAIAGEPAFTMTVNGSGFVSGSVVRWNGNDRSTTFVSVTKLTASIAAADVAALGTFPITVWNPAPTNLNSNAVTFTVGNVPPATECAIGADANAANPGLIGSGPSRAQLWRTGDNVWWAAFSNNTDGIYFYKRVNPTTWTRGSLIDTNIVAGVFVAGAPDCLWTGTNLFIMIQESQTLARLYKYTYNSAAQTYIVESGFPINLPLIGIGTSGGGKVFGTLAVEQDSTGRLWASYTGGGIGGDGSMRVIWSTSADHQTWDTNGFLLASGLSTLKTEGAAIVRFGGDKIGVAWSNLNAAQNSFAFHNDADPVTTWSATEVIDSGLGPEGTGPVSGKQMSMKAHPDGRIFLVSDDNDGVNNHLHLYIRTAARVWGNKTLVVNSFSAMPSKGLLLLDTDNSTVHVIYKDGTVTSNGLTGQTFITQASMTNPAFNTPCLFLDTSDDSGVQSTSNPTSTKQTINATTDLVAAASTGKGGNRILTNTVDITPNELSIFSISPAAATAGESTFTLTVTGKLFTINSVIRFNGSNRTTTFGNAGRLTASISGSAIATATTYPVLVSNGSTDSNTKNFIVTGTNPVPTLGLITPNREPAGSPEITMTLFGTGFRRSSVVRFNGGNRATQFVSDTQLTATIHASDLLRPGPYPITVFNLTPGGGSSSPTNVTTFYVIPACTPPAGQNFPGITLFNTVKSQMWYNDSLWWGAFSDNTTGVYFYKQTSTGYLKGALLDGNFNGRPDVFWNGTNLFVLVYEFNTLARLYKFSYNTITDTYALISGFPINLPLTGIGAGVSAAEVGSITLAQDSTGKLWAAYPGTFIGGDGNYRVIWSTSADHKTWNVTGHIFDSGGSVDTQEVAPIVHYGGNKIGIVYSKQPTKEVKFLYHNDGDPETTWSTPEMVDSGLGHVGVGGVADNHMSLRAAPDGRLFLVAKDSDFPYGYINLYVRSAAGVWSDPVLVDVDPHAAVTRPILLLELENSEAYVFYADATSGFMYLNKASMNNPVFGPACPYVSQSGVSDATSTRQNLRASMGLRAAGSSGGTASAIYINPLTLTTGSGNVPVLSTVSPSSVAFGSAVTVTVNGSNFASNAIVYFNGWDRPTTFVSSTQLTARLMATDVAALGTYPITVMNPKGGTSAAVNLSVNPAITTLSPASVVAGSAPFTLTVNGMGFVSGAVVKFNGINRITTFVNSTQLTAQILASDILTVGPQPITVLNPGAGGGTSAPSTLLVGNPLPTTAAISPTSVIAGGAAFMLTVNGSNFSGSSVVLWNGQSRPTSLVNSTQLTAQIPATDVEASGIFPITVFNPLPGGGLSGAVSFTVANPIPSLVSISPVSKMAGEPAFELTITGANFNSSSAVLWNGLSRATSVINGTQLTTQITAADIASAGTANVTVSNPGPGGGTASGTLTVNNPIPTLVSISPATETAGNPAFVLTANGNNFNSSSVVQWNGQNRATSYVSGTQLTAQVTAAEIGTAGNAIVTVNNPAPGGGTTNSATFTIKDNLRQMRINNTSAPSGSTVSLPVELDAQGNENALGFSVSFDASVLSNPQAAVGSDAGGASLNTNTTQLAQGRYGIALSLPSGQTFTAGTRQIVVLTFTLAAVGTQVTTEVSFADQPIALEVVDPNAVSLLTNSTPGTVTITVGYEADVAPRTSGGNNSVTIADWVQIGRFSSGLDTANIGSEFQRADCAPKSSLGNGSITISDWVQAGRYASGIDPVVPGGGPTGPPLLAPQPELGPKAEQAHPELQSDATPQTTIRFLDTALPAGQTTLVSIELDALGIENAVAFSFTFDPNRLSFVSAETGRDADAATMNVNELDAANGRVGIVLALPASWYFTAGTNQLVLLKFAVRNEVNDATLPGFSDQPIARKVVDVDANSLKVVFKDASLAGVNPIDYRRFLGQGYLKFLNRTIGHTGLDYWSGQQALITYLFLSAPQFGFRNSE